MQHQNRAWPHQESEELVAHGAKGAVVGLTNTQTLTNKTLTTPVINSATGVGQAKVVRKTADETVNNSAVLQNDDHLSFAIGANEIWAIDMMLIMSMASATPDLLFTFTLPASASMIVFAQSYASGGLISNAKGTTPGTGIGIGVDNSNPVVLIQATLVNSATSGTVQFQWAQNIATAEDSKILANSWIVAHRLA